MQNIILTPKTVADIDQRVERVLRGLGNPEPPLRLEDVRELLRLDRHFYTADNPGVLSETISKIRVATIQIFNRPTILAEAIKKLQLKALYLPDRKRILLDGDLPEKKHRWNEAHEVGHSILPWHDGLMHGDSDHTLSMSCHEQIEAEANFAAARLLFLQERFSSEALSLPPSFSTVKMLHGAFGNTMTTTLYRFVETIGESTPAVGVISGHPHARYRSADYDPANPCRHVVHSKAFRARFCGITPVDLFEAIASYCGPMRGGPLGESELILTDDNGEDQRFAFETFYNRHDALTLGVYLGPERTMVAF